jgi:hypothetical protein
MSSTTRRVVSTWRTTWAGAATSPEGMKLRLDLAAQVGAQVGDAFEPRELIEAIAGDARFGGVNVEPGPTKPVPLQGIVQGVFVDQGAAGSVDEQCVALHQCKLGRCLRPCAGVHVDNAESGHLVDQDARHTERHRQQCANSGKPVMCEMFRAGNKFPAFHVGDNGGTTVCERQAAAGRAIGGDPLPEFRRLGREPMMSEKEQLLSLRMELLNARHFRPHQ